MAEPKTLTIPVRTVDSKSPCAPLFLFDRVYHKSKLFTSPMMTFSCVMVFLIMILTITDVLGRFILNIPVTGSMELLEILMILAVFPTFVWIEH